MRTMKKGSAEDEIVIPYTLADSRKLDRTFWIACLTLILVAGGMGMKLLGIP